MEVTMKLSRTLGLFVCFCLFGKLAAYSGEAPDAELKTLAVAAFKNGLAFVVKQGDVRLENGAGRISPIPNATLGSLWITPNDAGASLDEVVAYHYKVVGRQNLTALADVLLANAGRVVTVGYNNQREYKEYTGEIVGFRGGERPTPEVSPAPTPSAANPYSMSSATPAPHVGADFLLLKADGRLLALYLHDITQVTLPADPVLQAEEERKALRFKVRGAGGRANVTMGYLENGLGWTPSYLVSLQDDGTAQITMQAVLTDDAEDLKDADVFFVVGVPNFAYAHIPSPMALQQTLLEFMQAANRKESLSMAGRPYSNALMGQLTVNAAVDEMAPSPSFATSVEDLTGAPEEDLFLYTRRGVTLARGERVTYNVFSGSVSYEHIYQWEVQDHPRVDGLGNVQNYPSSGGSDQAERNNIWHTLRVKNTTRFPWTSAPTMVISGMKPVSQDTLPYTPKGAASSLKLTMATDIRASHEEEEVSRQQNVERRRGHAYDQVTVEGTLKITNYKSKDVRLSISKTLRGSVESQSDDGKAEKLGEAIAVDNPMSRLTWEVTLKAGQERTITYRYKVWLRV
jgi:hypothetical protein